MSRRAICPIFGKNLKTGIYSKMSKTCFPFLESVCFWYCLLKNEQPILLSVFGKRTAPPVPVLVFPKWKTNLVCQLTQKWAGCAALAQKKAKVVSKKIENGSLFLHDDSPPYCRWAAPVLYGADGVTLRDSMGWLDAVPILDPMRCRKFGGFCVLDNESLLCFFKVANRDIRRLSAYSMYDCCHYDGIQKRDHIHRDASCSTPVLCFERV